MVILIYLIRTEKMDSYSTYDSKCEKQGNSYCYFNGFTNMEGDRIYRCTFCGTTNNPKKPVVRESFSDIISEVHNAKVEGREPVFKKPKLNIKF